MDPTGKTALTSFRVVDHFGTQATLMEVLIVTGRTHQIRVHAANAGHPIGGDDRYGDAAFNASLAALGLHRLFLHAHAVQFVWPEREEVFSVSVPLPEELSAVLDALNPRQRGQAGRRRAHAGRSKAR